MKIVYSTGPVENQDSGAGPYSPDKLYSTVTVNILNNFDNTIIKSKVKVFDVEGSKIKTDHQTLFVNPKTNEAQDFDVSLLNRFEIQISVEADQNLTRLEHKVLISTTGKNGLGEIVSVIPLTIIKAS